MKYILSVCCLAAALYTNSQQVFHDPDAQIRNVGAFTSVDVSSSIELELSQGKEDVVAVSTLGKGNIDALKTEVRNGVLRIWFDQKKWFNNNTHARAYVSAKSLSGVTGSGATVIRINGGLNSSSLSLRLSGASDFKGEVKAGSLMINISGASDMNLTGAATDLKVQASGASHLKGFDFVADNCLIDASGASDVKLTANKVINAEASGASNVYYRGSGQEGKIRSSGASSISRKG